MINTAPPASNSVYGREKLFWYDKRVDKPGSAPGVFPFGLFFFIITADPAGHALGSIYILSLSPEFYFGKGISKVLDLHTGQAYDQKKTISCQDMYLLWNSWMFFNVRDIMTNNT